MEVEHLIAKRLVSTGIVSNKKSSERIARKIIEDMSENGGTSSISASDAYFIEDTAFRLLEETWNLSSDSTGDITHNMLQILDLTRSIERRIKQIIANCENPID